jgi:hypothetical protein
MLKNVKAVIMEISTSKRTLENVLQNKVHSIILNDLEASQPALDLIQKETTLLQDHILPINLVRFLINDSKRLQIELNNSGYFLSTNASVQLSERMGLPSAWVNSMIQSNIEWKTGAIAGLFNEYVKNFTNENILVRTVGDEARAVLSGRYHRIDSQRIYIDYIEGLRNVGAQLFNAAISEDGLKVYFDGVYEELLEVQTTKGLIYLTVGTRLSHSDYGPGDLSLRTYLLQPLSTNGIVMENFVKKVQLGTVNSNHDKFSQKNLLSDTLAYSYKIQEILKNIFSKKTIAEILSKVRKAVETEINYAEKIRTLEKRITKEEAKELSEVLAADKIDDGLGNIDGQNIWKLAQGLGAVARCKAVSQKIKLEEVAGSLI